MATTITVNVSQLYEEDTIILGIPQGAYTALLLFAFFTNLVGNTCVIWTIFKMKRLEPVQSLYVLNLAITDLLLAVSVLPMMILWYARHTPWEFGTAACKAMLVFDYVICAESVCTIVLISHDRYLVVTEGARYNLIQTNRRVLIKIGATWIWSCVIQLPPIVGWEYWRGYTMVPEGNCDREFSNDTIATLISQLLIFAIPLTIVSVFSILTIFELRKRYRKVAAVKMRQDILVQNILFSKGADLQVVDVDTSDTDARIGASGNTDAFGAVNDHTGTNSGASANAGEHKQAGGSINIGANEQFAGSVHATGCYHDTGRYHDTGTVNARGSVQYTGNVYDTECLQSTGSECFTGTVQSIGSVMTGSAYSIGSLHSTGSAHTTRSVYSKGSVYLKGSVYSIRSAHSAGCIYSTQSVQPTENVYCTGNKHATENVHSIDSVGVETNEHAVVSAKTSNVKNEQLEVGTIRHLTNKTARGRCNVQISTTTKATWSLVLVIIVFMICWLPSSVLYVVHAYCNGCIKRAILELVDLILWFNSSLNPLVYFVSNKKLRECFISMISENKGCANFTVRINKLEIAQ